MEYRPRVIDGELPRSLTIAGAVILEGPRGCGKTSTALQYSRSAVFLDTDANARALAELAPDALLEGDTPRLIDEWQNAPEVWNQVRRRVDQTQLKGQFILTGSALQEPDRMRHTGAGRFLRLKMRPMTLAESGASDSSVSFGDLLHTGELTSTRGDTTLRDVVDDVCRGGWPAFRDLAAEDAVLANRSYLTDVVESDFSLGRSPRNRTRVNRLLRSLARHVGSQASLQTIAKDVSSEGDAIRGETVGSYLGVLGALHITEDLPAWSGNLRSRYPLRQADTRYFVDPSLAVAALGATPSSLLGDLNTLGFLFENLVLRDLRVFAQHHQAQVFHFRDASGHEVDAIVDSPDGTTLAVEVKLGGGAVDQAAKRLSQFREKRPEGSLRDSTRLAVITAGDSSYLRKDGVAVVSVRHLGL